MMKYKTIWITLCKNEQDILPFCIDYWKRIADKVVVFDNHSTDDSLNILSKETWIEVRTFQSKGQNDFIQREVKEKAYNEFKNDYDIIIISDCDELFYFDKFEDVVDEMITGGYNIISTPLYSLCEDSKPEYTEGKLLHQLCSRFYYQRLNHMNKMDRHSKLSIFNTKIVDRIKLSVGQHIVTCTPANNILYTDKGFCLHIDKGFGLEYKYNVRQKMNSNLSRENKNCSLCSEYGISFDRLKEEYLNNQNNSFNINEKVGD